MYSGFVYALSVADQHIKTGMCKNVLVIGSDVLSQLCDPTDRSTIILFGDGAGAVVLGVKAMSQVSFLHTFTLMVVLETVKCLKHHAVKDTDKWLHMAVMKYLKLR